MQTTRLRVCCRRDRRAALKRLVSSITIDYEVPMRLKDGVLLATDIYRPSQRGRYPTILIRTPYNKLAAPMMMALDAWDTLGAVRAGYVVAIQDVRGTFASGGDLRHFHHEAEDGAEAIAWAAAQPWSNGLIGMMGSSYYAATQLLSAIRTPSALTAMVPAITGSEYYDGWTYQGGAFQLGFTLRWAAEMAHADMLNRETRGEDVSAGREALESVVHDPWEAFWRLPLVELPNSSRWLRNYGEWLAHPDRDQFWRSTAITGRYDRIDVPALHIAGWNDIFLKGSLENFVGLRGGAASEHARQAQRLIVTPWAHDPPLEYVGEVLLGPAGHPFNVNLALTQLEFFDHHLKGEPADEAAPVQIFMMGANEWRDETEWPLTRAVPTRLYLRANGALSCEAPADEEPDEFSYDPRDPVPTVGGNTYLPGSGFFTGPRDRRAVEQRSDVLVYTTLPLQDDQQVIGPVKATLSVATSAPDTDFTVALVDVHPDGRAMGVADGILRLRYRHGLDRQVLAEPGRRYEIEVDLVATANVFKAGHRIRVEVSSSNFPRFDRNPNNGGVIAEASVSDLATARQHVFHDRHRASFITLPTVK
jgi:putative CocE/NonD family hydrolase